MTIEKFGMFTTPQQCYYIIKRGVYLATFHDLCLSIDLYEVNNFYVEVFYEHGKTECLMARAFKGTFELNKYLENISVAELFDS
jgi:hypothetical protein